MELELGLVVGSMALVVGTLAPLGRIPRLVLASGRPPQLCELFELCEN